MPLQPPLKSRRVAVVFAVLVLGLSFTALAAAKTIGIVPPKNPKRNCSATAAQYRWNLTSIDRCRAAQGVGPLRLPKNWSALTMPEKLLVIIDLERVNRGLPPVVGLSPALDALAAKGAASDSDPPFPKGNFWEGSIWAGVDTVQEADYGWMYDDGWGKHVINEDCTSAHAKGCWGHRDNILMHPLSSHGKPLAIVAGGAYKKGAPYDSFAFEFVAGYSRKHLSFTWSSELKHFAHRPTIEPRDGA